MCERKGSLSGFATTIGAATSAWIVNNTVAAATYQAITTNGLWLSTAAAATGHAWHDAFACARNDGTALHFFHRFVGNFFTEFIHFT